MQNLVEQPAAEAAAPHGRCFVISPIGAEQTDIREHADDVFDFIIKPAAVRAGYLAHRGDHNAAPGKITEQMFKSILNDELIVCVLTFKNPNVYYELAVAQSAARPVVLMIQKGEELPFDIRDQRVVRYDLRPRPLSKGSYVDDLYKTIRELEAQKESKVPFATEMEPLGGSKSSLVLWTHQSDFKTNEYVEFMSSSERRLLLSGISMHGWHRSPHYPPALKQLLERGCEVRVLLMDPANPALGQMLNGTSRLDSVRGDIEASLETWNELARQSHLEVRTVRRGIIYGQNAINEKRLAYTPYCYSVATQDSPSFLVDADSPLYGAQLREFERLWEANAPETPARNGGQGKGRRAAAKGKLSRR